jgi:hypothetical protein
VLDKPILRNMNCVLWIIVEPYREYKKDLNLDKIEVIIDLSVEKNFNICKGLFDEMID